jgi:hypothetical protein
MNDPPYPLPYNNNNYYNYYYLLLLEREGVVFLPNLCPPTVPLE